MCRIPVNKKHVKEFMADVYWQQWQGLNDKASQWHGKTGLEGFPSTQLQSEADRENAVKKKEKGEKVWDWVNSVYPCHMSLAYPFPHCRLVASNSSSDTQNTTYLTLGTRERMSTYNRQMGASRCLIIVANCLLLVIIFRIRDFSFKKVPNHRCVYNVFLFCFLVFTIIVYISVLHTQPQESSVKTKQ